MKTGKNNFIGMFILVGIVFMIFLASFASAFSNPQITRPGASTFSSLGGTSFPSFDDSMCEAGQDFIVQISPLGCEPSVIRSDLLEEQNIPVFCQLMATKINPLIEVDAIDSISFERQTPSKSLFSKLQSSASQDIVSGVGFYPARAAVKSQKTLLNSPVLENIGYVVIVLGKQKNESAMPDWVEGNLTAKISYDIKNAFGVGSAEYYLPQMDDSQWEQNYKQYGFWQARGFLRAEEIDENSATISVYRDKEHKSATVTLEEGKTSREVRLPGFYCMGGMQLRLNSLENPATRAKFDINGEIVEVAEREKFLDNACVVNTIIKQGIVQRVTGACATDERRGEKFDLMISPKIELKFDGAREDGYSIGEKLYTTSDGQKSVYLGYIGNRGDPSSLDDLYLYLVASPESKDKLSASEISAIARMASYERDPLTTDLNSENLAKLGKKIIGITEQSARWLISGELYNKLVYVKGAKDILGKKVEIIGFAGAEAKAKNLEEVYTLEKKRDVTGFLGSLGSSLGEIYSVKTQESIDTGLSFSILEKTDSLYHLTLIKDDNTLVPTLYGYFTPIDTKCTENCVYKLDKSKYYAPPDDTNLFEGFFKNLVDTKLDMKSKTLTVWRPVSDVKKEKAEYVEYYNQSLKDYRKIIDSYSSEKEDNSLETFGEKALINSIQLARQIEDKKTMVELCNEFKERYPNSLMKVSDDCENIYKLSNIGSDVKEISINGRVKSIFFEGIYEPGLDEYSAGVKIRYPDGKSDFFILRKNDPIYINDAETDFIQLTNLDDDYAELNINTAAKEVNGKKVGKVSTTQRLKKNVGESFGTEYIFTLTEINLKKQAKVSVIPNIKNAGTEANFSFKIGIEKRAIQLSPEQIKERLKNLNETVEKWEKLSANLGNAVKGFKAACVTTGFALTIKNLWAGTKGKAGARHEVTATYRNKCNSEIKDKNSTYFGKSISECLVGYNDEINSQVDIWADKEMNQKEFTEKELCNSERAEGLRLTNDTNCEGVNFENINAELTKPLENNECNSQISASEARRFEFHNSIIADTGVSEEVRKNAEIERCQLLKDINENVRGDAMLKKAQEVSNSNNFSGNFRTAQIKGQIGEYWEGYSTGKSGIKDVSGNTPYQKISLNNVAYIVSLEDNGDGTYRIKNVYDSEGKNITENAIITNIKNTYSSFKKYDASSYKNNGYDSPEVIYWETGEFKGLPQIVPVDIKNGWYALTEQSSRGTIKAYDESGALNYFNLCNVMENHRQDGIGKDKCQGFWAVRNVNEGEEFSGLSLDETRKLVKNTKEAISEASRKYKSGIKGKISILGQNVEIGNPAVNLPGTQCEDFMSPSDCNILFNVCDPVVCPSSRCNYGGKYHVSNVIQSGIIGSAMLCLPNFGMPSEGGVLVPVCLSGLHAGAEGYLSIVKSHRDCLQKNLETGEMVGFCDEVYSIYACEFFWRQALPLAKMGIPKAIDWMYRGTPREDGGGEYLMFQEAWDNAGKTVDYMTQYYAANSYEAFILRSTDQLGSAVCKNFISARYPASGDFFDALIEPDVPVQYNAWFNEIPFTTTTVPPTSQYKVFYHIYAGKDSGAYYNVYLRTPAAGGYYQEIPSVTVANGYIAKGDYASETKDFTASAGYSELCINVNGKEECGFKSVSTSFAMDYLKDQVMKDQLERGNITSEKECISGSPSLYGFISPNVQEGAQQAINPEIYKSGITRVCSTENPGKGTTNERWQDVGKCGEEKLRCWLDKESIKTALEFNATQNSLKDFTDDALERMRIEGGYLSDEDFNKLTDKVCETPMEINKYLECLKKLTGEINDDTIKKSFFNKQKAILYLKRGDIYGELSIWKKILRELEEAEKEKKGEPKEVKTSEEELKEKLKREGFGEGTEINTIIKSTKCEDCGGTNFDSSVCGKSECSAIGEKLGKNCEFIPGTITGDSWGTCKTPIEPTGRKGGGVTDKDIFINLVKESDSKCSEYAGAVYDNAIEYGIEPSLLMGVMMQESSCNPEADSGSSRGLMQINSKVWCGKYGLPSDETDCISRLKEEPNTNINIGAQILKKYYDEFKDGVYESWSYKNIPDFTKIVANCISKYPSYRDYSKWNAALRAYNGWGCGAGADTDYVENVMKRYNELKEKLKTLDISTITSSAGEKNYKINFVNLMQDFTNKKILLHIEHGCDSVKYEIISSGWFSDTKSSQVGTITAEKILEFDINSFEVGEKYYVNLHCLKDGKWVLSEKSNVLKIQ